LSVQFRQKTRTQIYIDFSYVDSPSLARVLNYCSINKRKSCKSWSSISTTQCVHQ